jgi:hypothetical protein
MANLDSAVRDQIALYVEDYISADRLNDALPDTWELDEADESLTELVMLVIGYLAEYQSGGRLDEDLRKALAPYAGWSIDRQSVSNVKSQPGFLVRVGAAAGTPLLAVHG